jgi:hypothetical protein
MNEDILRIVVRADQEAVAAQPVEPFHPHRLERSRLVEQLGRIDPVTGRRRAAIQLRHDRLTEIDRQDLARLQAARLLGDEQLDDRAFGKTAPVMLLEHAEMDQHVALGALAHREAESPRRIEPCHRPRKTKRCLRIGRDRGFPVAGKCSGISHVLT